MSPAHIPWKTNSSARTNAHTNTQSHTQHTFVFYLRLMFYHNPNGTSFAITVFLTGVFAIGMERTADLYIIIVYGVEEPCM